MALEAGTRLGIYEVLSSLGVGGMGEVYRARDTKLGREVAIKVLAEGFSQDPERMARFEREARALAALNHPNVATLHGFETASVETAAPPIPFLVMELVEGETLAERIKRGAIAVAEALPLFVQIAEGLEAAHESGVIHRDLKPANIKISPQGRLKILDFGLAKAMAREGPPSHDPGLSQSPTLTLAATQRGEILGTAAYMSPEQARGQEVDERTDVWAFGCVVFEMLTGRIAFGGETVSDTLAAVLRQEVDLAALPPGTPEALRRLLRRCLEKDGRQRLHHVADARLELAEALDPAAEDFGPPPAASRRRGLGLGVVAVAAAAIVGLLFGRFVLQNEARRPERVRVVSMTPLTDLPGHQHSPALSPDGKRLLYVSDDGADDDIFLQRVSGERPINLTADSEARDFQPAFSPDGERIAFVSSRDGGGIFVMGATGESPRLVTRDGYDPAWSPDGEWILFTKEHVISAYSRQAIAPLYLVRPDGSELHQLAPADAVGASWSPDGRRIAFWTNLENEGQRDIYTTPVEGGESVAVTLDAATDWSPVWSPDGRWLYFLSDRGGSPDLWRVAIDPQTGRALEEPQAVTSGTARIEELALARDDRRLAVTIFRREGRIESYDFDSRQEHLGGFKTLVRSSANAVSQTRLSPDGEWLVSRTTAPTERIFLQRADGSESRWLTDGVGRNRGPVFSPDGEWIVFYSNRGGDYQIWGVRTDGTGLRQVTNLPGAVVIGVDWRRDGTLTFSALGPEGGGTTMMTAVAMEGFDALESPLSASDVVVPPGADRFSPNSWSADGRYLAGTQSLGGGQVSAMAVYVPESQEVRPFLVEGEPVVAGTPLVANWLDRARLLYWDQDRRICWIWDLDDGEIRPLEGAPGPANYLVSPDGRTLYAELLPVESDIWLLELAGPR